MPNFPVPPLAGTLSIRSFVMFLAIGGIATGLQYSIAAVLHLGFGFGVVAASSTGFAVSALFNYFLNERLTFQGGGSYRNSAPKFALTSTTGLAVNSLLMFVLLRAGVSAVIAQILSTMGVLIWNYTINGLWTFKKPSA